MDKEEMEEQIVDLRDSVSHLMKSNLELYDELTKFKLIFIESIINPYKRLKIIKKFANCEVDA